ncbi:TetR/AcrR family transcriptional regulator [Baekduia sp.]|uniref:TetR/AcrR family transcriptional regulator n=1 Tax=Baekduia sp. TaxID=2600305 RepID=UPI002DF73B02|nr:TetR family transcriptional regulator C-terminal domain-containing protein [Baekduia sp.]
MADRKHIILDAAISVIARKGLGGLRVEEVAERAGVAVSLLYYHFDNRRGLVRATLEHANERAAQTIKDLSADQRTGAELIITMLLAELEDPAQARELSVLWSEVMASAFFDPSLRDQLAEASDRWAALVADAVWRGQEDGSIGALTAPADLAALLTSMVDGLSARWLAGLITRERARELLAMSVMSMLGIHHATVSRP